MRLGERSGVQYVDTCADALDAPPVTGYRAGLLMAMSPPATRVSGFARPATWYHGGVVASALLLAGSLAAGCRTEPVASGPPPPLPTVERVRRPDLDSLTASLAMRADTLAPARLPALEGEIRAWLGRLEYGDPSLVTDDETDPRRALRPWRGRLYDALGWSSFRRGASNVSRVPSVRAFFKMGTAPFTAAMWAGTLATS